MGGWVHAHLLRSYFAFSLVNFPPQSIGKQDLEIQRQMCRRDIVWLPHFGLFSEMLSGLYHNEIEQKIALEAQSRQEPDSARP